MKKYFLFVLIIFLSSCASSLKIQYTDDPRPIKNWKKIAILELIISPADSPSLPLIDASIYNAVFNSIFPDIALFQVKYTDSLINHLGKSFSLYSKNEILYGLHLYNYINKDSLNILGIKTYPTYLDNEDFPKLAIPEYTYNFFDFSKVTSPKKLFNDEFFSSNILQFQKISSYLGVDGIVFGTVAVYTTDIGAFGTCGDRQMFSSLYFVDKDGKLITCGFIESEEESSDADDLDEYRRTMKCFLPLSDKLLRILYLNEKEEGTRKEKRKISKKKGILN